MAQKHGWTESLVWSQALVNANDFDWFKLFIGTAGLGIKKITFEEFSATSSLTINSGWNLIGLKSNETKPITDLISDSEAKIAKLII